MTQEFVTLPREVVEQALDALFMYKPMVTGVTFQHGLEAMQALRAALEHPQVVREAAPNGATHIQPQQGAFYKRVDEKWYVWSRMEDGRPHRWYISPGTVESCLKPISAATEQPQVEQEPSPTAGMNIAQRILHVGGRNNAAGYVEFGGIQAVEALVRQVLRDLPRQHEPQVEQEPVAWISPSALEWSTRESEKVVKLTRKAQPEYDFTEPLYTHPQPAQKPLTDDQVLKAVRHLYQSDLPVGMGFSDDLDVARAIEAAHNIK